MFVRLDFGLARLSHGQTDDERGAVTLAVTARLNGSGVKLDQMPGDRETQTKAAVLPGKRAVRLPEVEHIRQECRIDANATVGHLDLRGAVARRDIDGHASTIFRELHGVRQQVADHLLQPAGVADDGDGGCRAHLKVNPFGCRRGRDRLRASMRNRGEINRLHIQMQTPRHPARDVQHVVDKLHLSLRIARDRLERMGRLFGIELSGQKHAGPAEYRGKRCPQLVRQRGEKFVLEAIQLLGLTEQTRVLDGKETRRANSPASGRSAAEYSRRDSWAPVPNEMTPIDRPRTSNGTPRYA